MGNKTLSKAAPMVFSNGNIWLGTEDSLEPIYSLNKFLADPLSASEKSARLGIFDDDDDGEDKRYEGIGSHLIQVEGSLGIIHVKGSMSNRYSYWNQYFGVVSYPEIRDSLASLANDSEIKDTLLLIDTGGGAAQGCPELAEFITSVDRNVKPVYAHTTDHCFSAGMWLASSARKFTANRIAEQGSVGVVVTLVSYHKLYERAGLETVTVRGGKFKALGQPTEPITDEVISMIESKVDRLYGYFVEAVSAGRPSLTVETKDIWAEGKTFFSEESLLLGMIDEITSFDKLVANFLTSYNNTNINYGLSDGSQNEEDDTMGAKTATKKVLSPELAAAAASGAVIETSESETEVNVGDGVTEPTAAEGAEAELSTETETETEAGLDAGQVSLQDKYIKQSIDMAKLEDQLATLQAQVTTAQAEVASLKGIAIEAINNREIAINRSPTSSVVLSEMSVSSLVSLNEETKTKFSEKYAIGGKAEVSPQPREESASANFMPLMPE